jgi:hypothetical protein
VLASPYSPTATSFDQTGDTPLAACCASASHWYPTRALRAACAKRSAGRPTHRALGPPTVARGTASRETIFAEPGKVAGRGGNVQVGPTREQPQQWDVHGISPFTFTSSRSIAWLSRGWAGFVVSGAGFPPVRGVVSGAEVVVVRVAGMPRWPNGRRRRSAGWPRFSY